MPRQLLVVDPNLADDSGHYAAYLESFRDEVIRRGLTLRVLANRKVGPRIQSALAAEPVFRYDLFHAFPRARWMGRIPAPILSNSAHFVDLRTGLRGADRRSLVFVPTIDHRHMLAWGWWLSLRSRGRLPHVVMLLRYNYTEFVGQLRWRPEVRWARRALRLLERAAHGRLRLATDSERLAEEYRELTGLDIEVFPIPHTDDVVHHRAASRTDESARLRFVSLGDARTAKGFAVLAEAIKLLHARGQADGIEFVLQSRVVAAGQDAARTARNELAARAFDNVALVDEELERGAYLDLLYGADVVVIPYSRQLYISRTSGPFCEALAAGKPVIVTDDTWMSDQLSGRGAGVTVADGDPADLVRAILETRDRHRELSDRAAKARAAWVEIHNPVGFVDALLGAAHGPTSPSVS